MLNQNLLTLASKLILASTTGDETELQRVSENLAAELSKEISGGTAPSALDKDITGFLNFTNKEISNMPKAFRHTFIAEGKVICYRKRKRGRVSCSYEARYRRHGYNISVSSTNLIDLKKNFIQALHSAEINLEMPTIPETFHEFATYYFENFWKRKVSAETYKVGMCRYKNHIFSAFRSFPLKRITPLMCQQLIDNLNSKGLGKTADETHSMLNQIFNAAINHGILSLNPIAMIYHEQHICEPGKVLSKSEELKLLNAFSNTPYQIMFAVALYTGLRPNELKTARIENGFVVAVNSKRKNKKVEYKKIPIIEPLKKYLGNTETIKFNSVKRIRDKFNEILPEHVLKDLRKTFNTRCEECGVLDTARKKFMGHTLGKLREAYTELSDEFLISEGSKLNKWYISPEFAPISD